MVQKKAMELWIIVFCRQFTSNRKETDNLFLGYTLGSHEIFAATQLSVSVYVPRPILLSYLKKKISFLKKNAIKSIFILYI